MLYVQQGKLNVNLKFNALFAFLIPSLRMKKKEKKTDNVHSIENKGRAWI